MLPESQAPDRKWLEKIKVKKKRNIQAETSDISDLKFSGQETSGKEDESRKFEISFPVGFLYGIAHDFSNILATISGYSEMLQDDLPRDSPLSEKVSKIQNSVSKAQSIIDQIYTINQQVGQKKISINLPAVLEETIGFVKSSLPSNIIIKKRIQKKDTNVLADPSQLFRVFLNIMTNAIQSMEEKGGTLSVGMGIVEGKSVYRKLRKDIVADEYVLLTFRDTGKGIESSLLDRIFEPFFTTRGIEKGTGLGLSVVHGIVRELEGEILVSSKKGIGSVFKIYLPVSQKVENYPTLHSHHGQ